MKSNSIRYFGYRFKVGDNLALYITSPSLADCAWNAPLEKKVAKSSGLRIDLCDRVIVFEV